MAAIVSKENIRLKLVHVVKEVLKVVDSIVEDEIDLEIERIRLARKRRSVYMESKDVFVYKIPKEPLIECPVDYNALKMTEESFNELLNIIGPVIQKSDTVMRSAMQGKLKLYTMLYMLVNGSSLRALNQLFKVPKSTVSKFITDVCEAIYDGLKDYIKLPGSTNAWKVIEEGFRNTWNFPDCCGAIARKKVLFNSAKMDKEDSDDIVLTAAVDHNYCFIYYDISRIDCDGFISDRDPKIPQNLLLNDCVIIGDDSFALKTHLMKPYGGNTPTYKEKVFDYRINRARGSIDNAFGLLTSRFRIFERALSFRADRSEQIVKACLALHNWMRKTNIEVESASVDVEDPETGFITTGSWRDVPSRGLVALRHNHDQNRSPEAEIVRDKYSDYFTGDGAIPSQFKMIKTPDTM